MRQLASKIPIGLIYSRLLIGLLLVGLSYYHAPHYGPVAVALLVVGVLTDVFDGIVARQLGISTQRLRRLDRTWPAPAFSLKTVGSLGRCWRWKR